MSWARRLKRVFGIQIENCARCGGTLKIIASVEKPQVIAKIPSHLERTAPEQYQTELPRILIASTANGTAVGIPSENVLFSGLTPTLVGLWQINVRIPTTVPSGSAVPTVALMSSVPSTEPGAVVTAATTIAIK